MMKNHVSDAGDGRRYFIQIPNLIDDMGLSVYAVRLYLHLKRVAGDTGACWQSTRTMADHCKMSPIQVSRVKKELEAAGLIAIATCKSQRGGKDYHEITINDIWPLNAGTYQVLASTSQMQASTPGATQEEHTKKIPKIKHPSENDTALEGLIRELFHINPDISRNGWVKCFGFLKDKQSTDIQRFARWWWTSDWRGQKGQAPTSSQIIELWPQAFKVDQKVFQEIYNG